MNVRNLLLDFDGTMADSSVGIHRSFCKACFAIGREPPGLDEFKRKIGPPVEKLSLQFFPELTSDEICLFRTIFRKEYDSEDYVYLTWAEGIRDTLEKLKFELDLKLCVVSNKPTLTCRSLLAKANLTDFFDSIVGIDYLCVNGLGSAFKCKSHAINHVVATLKLKPCETFYVGDTYDDYVQATVAGISFIAAQFGFYTWQHQSLPISSIPDFPSLVNCVHHVNQ